MAAGVSHGDVSRTLARAYPSWEGYRPALACYGRARGRMHLRSLDLAAAHAPVLSGPRPGSTGLDRFGCTRRALLEPSTPVDPSPAGP